MIHFGIITAPRPVPTLQRSVASLRAAGFDGHIVISSDDPQVASPKGCYAMINSPALGNLRNWVACLNRLLTLATDDADWLCVCEDDISWVPNSIDRLEGELKALRVASSFSRNGALSLFFPIAMARDIDKGTRLSRGWYPHNRGFKTWGAQCFLLSRTMAIDLLESDGLKGYLADPKWTKNVDGIVAHSLLKLNLSILYRVPCLVDHDLGEGNSSLGYREDRPKLRTEYFTGAV